MCYIKRKRKVNAKTTKRNPNKKQAASGGDFSAAGRTTDKDGEKRTCQDRGRYLKPGFGVASGYIHRTPGKGPGT